MVESKSVFQTASGPISYWTYRAPGENTPWMVMLPGTAVDHRLFGKQVEYFADKLNMLCWDAPSHGESRPFPATWSLDDMANWIHGILEREGISQPILVGHSFGGCVAQAYMDLYPGRAAGFVSVDSLPLDHSYSSGLQRFLYKNIMSMFKPIPFATMTKMLVKQNVFSDEGRAVMEEMTAPYSRKEYFAISDQCFATIAAAMGDNRVYRIGCPAVLLLGDKDGAYAIPQFNRQWAEREGYPLEMIPNSGHNSCSDNPAVANAAIERFLKQHNLIG